MRPLQTQAHRNKRRIHSRRRPSTAYSKGTRTASKEAARAFIRRKTPEAQTSVDDDGTDIVSQGTDTQGEDNGDTVLPGPRVLMEEDILQGYRI